MRMGAGEQLGGREGVQKRVVISFRADQRHSYSNPTRETAVGYSVVLLAPVGAR